MKNWGTCLDVNNPEIYCNKESYLGDFPDGPVVKSLPCNAGDMEQLSLHTATGNLHVTTRDSALCKERSCTTNQRSLMPVKTS